MQTETEPLALFDDIADGYYQTDLHGRLTIVNRPLCCILGCGDISKLLGTDALRFFDAEAVQRLQPVFAEILKTGTAVRAIESAITRLDGERSTVEFSTALRRNAGGEPIGYCGIVRDVTERTRAADSLNQRFSELALLQQVDVELNQTLALDSVLAVALNAALLLSGAEAGFIGLIEHEKLRLARSVGGFEEAWMSLDTGIIARAMQTQHAEYVLDVMSDPDYYADLPTTRAEIAVPLIARNKVVGVLNLETAMPVLFTPDVFEFTQLVCSRISAAVENARLYETLQAQLAELRGLYTQVSDLEQLKTHMIRVAAHDLRGPLAIVASYIELLDEDLAVHYNDMDQMYVNSIRTSVTRMTQMTTDILSLERLDEHREVTLMRVSLGALLERAVEEYAEQSRRCELDVRVNIEPLAVYGDSAELHEAIANLIGNAIKYTPSGGTIEARLQRDGEFALLEIIDSGFGIPEDQQQELFQPFRRIKTRETYAIEGTGLGLYLVKRIVERHGGTICFESEHGKGSTFGFRLPLAKSNEQPE
ncbi:MAG: GAF domain-containing protein [Chloroflexi bacterium]|nr:GAF domain-containing protein [Chloroflexota bacterium]